MNKAVVGVIGGVVVIAAGVALYANSNKSTTKQDTQKQPLLTLVVRCLPWDRRPCNH